MQSEKKHFTAHHWYPWLVIALAAAFLFYKYVLQVSPSIMTEELMHIFQIQGTGLGNLAASFFYSFLLAQLFVGVLLDRYSPRLLTTLAILLCAIGIYIFSKAHSLNIAICSRVLIGVGAAFATVSYMKMTSLWFKPNQFAFVGGLLATAAMLGAIAGEVPLSFAVNTFGWRQSLYLCAVSGLILAGLYYFIVRDKPAGVLSQTGTVEKFSFHDVWMVLNNKQNWLITLYSGLAFSPIDAFAGLWCIPFLKVSYHATHTQAAVLTSLIFLGLAFGSPLLGLWSDRLNKRVPVMLINAFVALVTITLIIYVNYLPLWLLGTLLFIFGFSTGAFMLGFALGRELNKITVAATIIALINTGDIIFSALTQPLIGKLLDANWHGKLLADVHYFSAIDYRHALSILPVYILLALILLFFIRDSNPQQLEV
ncbi:MAG: MFS transporter [Gammaproteobacteria bacterium]|nr:MFS transporter [Gammaproteobacteria bacterium]